MRSKNEFGLVDKKEILVKKKICDADGTPITLFVSQEDEEAFTVGTSFYSTSDEEYIVDSILFCQRDQLLELAAMLQEAHKKILEGV